MSKTRVVLLVLFALVTTLTAADAETASDRVAMSFVRMGEAESDAVAWTARAPGASVVLSRDHLSVALAGERRRFGLRFLGTRGAASSTGIGRLPGRTNLLVGADPSRWHTGLEMWSGVVLRRLYPGVDLRFEGAATALKGTFVVAPGADPGSIRWRFDGIDGVRQRLDGGLELTVGSAVLTETAPVAWQERGDGSREPVDVGYLTAEDGTVGFALGHHDRTRPLVIDPYLEFATLVGGDDGDEGRDVVVDADGSIYVTGSTLSPDFPGSGPPQAGYGGPTSPSNLGDAFVLKLAPDGSTVRFMTYLGGSGADVGDAIALDPQGNIVIAGSTESTDFPTAAALQGSQGGQDCSSGPCNDLFVAKLTASGDSLVFSTYLGGARDESQSLVDFGTRQHTMGLDVDNAGSIYVTGTSDSDDFPVVGGFQPSRAGLADLVLAKLSPDGGQLLYSTYLGGGGAEYSGDVTVDDGGRAWLVGGTLSSDFPVRNAFDSTKHPQADAVVALVNTAAAGTGSLVAATYLGGDQTDQAFGADRDADGRIYVAGITGSSDFPTAGAFQSDNASAGQPNPRDGFVTVFAADLRSVGYSTYFGGSGRDLVYDVDVSPAGTAVVAGTTTSDDLPVRLVYQSRRMDGIDLFVAELDPDVGSTASLVGASYLGGADSEVAYGIDTALDGSMVVTGSTGGVVSDTFPVDRTIGPNGTGDGVLVARLNPRKQLWMLVGSRANGANDSIWRTDVGLFNPDGRAAEVELRFHGSTGVVSRSFTVGPGAQRILRDAVGTLGGSGNGAIEVVTDAEVAVTSRTYNLVARGASCSADGTLGQGFGSFASRETLLAGDAAWLPQLMETAAYRTNIAVTNTGLAPAEVKVTLYDGGGAQIGSTTLDVAPGQWRQLNRPFLEIAGRSDLAAGSAKVEVDEGGGIIAVGSVVDNITNDPTTIPMVPADGAGATTNWVLVGSRANGANNSRWRTDLGILNTSGGAAQATVRVHAPGGVRESTVSVGSGDQVILSDVMDLVSFTGSAAFEVVGDRPLVVSSRTYNQIAGNQACWGGGTLGQGLFGHGPGDGLAQGEAAWLTQLTENPRYRTNIALTNTGGGPATVRVRLFNTSGDELTSYTAALAPGEWQQDNRPFNARAGLSNLESGYARVEVVTGAGVLAVGSVVDNITNDPTTVVPVD